MIYSVLDEGEAAVRWLEQAERGGLGILIVIGVEPTFAPLRTLPGFQALLRRLGLA